MAPVRREYPTAKDADGVVTTGDSEAFMERIKTDFGIQAEDMVHVGIGKDLRHTPKSRLFDEFNMTVTAIEAGISSLNKTPTAVVQASIDALELCRARLMELEDPDVYYGTEKEKEDDVKEVFAQMKYIRLANNRENSWKWMNDFASSLGTQVNEAATWKNIKYAMAGLVVSVVFATLVSVFFPPAIPFIIAAAAVGVLYGAYKMFSTAWEYATNKATEEKVAAGDHILRTTVERSNDDLEVAAEEMGSAKEDMDQAESKMEAAKDRMEIPERDYTSKKQALNEFVAEKKEELVAANDRFTTREAAIPGIIFDLNADIRELNPDAEGYDAALQNLERQIAELRQELGTIADSIEENNRLMHFEEVITELEDQNSELVEAIAGKEEELNAAPPAGKIQLERDIAGLKQNIIENKAEIQERQRLLGVQYPDRIPLQKAVTKAEEKFFPLKNIFTRLQTEYTSHKTNYTKKQAVHGALDTKHQKLNAALEKRDGVVGRQRSLKERLKAAAPPPKTAVATPVDGKKFGV